MRTCTLLDIHPTPLREGALWLIIVRALESHTWHTKHRRDAVLWVVVPFQRPETVLEVTRQADRAIVVVIGEYRQAAITACRRIIEEPGFHMDDLIALEGELWLLKVMLFLQDILLYLARNVLLPNFISNDLHSTRICDCAVSLMPDSYVELSEWHRWRCRSRVPDRTWEWGHS
jgi:hypothetical protein